jgi:hypothetical protein
MQTRPGVEAKLVSRSPRYLPLAAEFVYCAQRSCGRRRRRRRRRAFYGGGERERERRLFKRGNLEGV